MPVGDAHASYGRSRSGLSQGYIGFAKRERSTAGRFGKG
jgi:hypothetical protein